MEQLISFTLMLNKLTDIELNQFVTNIIKTHGSKLISKLFFSYFAGNQSKIEPFTNYITNIINARKNQEKRQLKYECIDKLPSALIGECASYLLEKEYFRFAQCNRQVYISVNKPLKLYKISLNQFQKYPQSMSMHKFKLIKQLNTDITYFNEGLSDSNRLILKNLPLNTLLLSNNFLDEEQSNYTEFFNKNPFHFNKIKQIVLCEFGYHGNGFNDPEYPFNAKSFVNLLSSLAKMEYLELNHIYLTPIQFTKDDIIKWFPNLKHVKCQQSVNTNLCQQLINTFSHQLESLSLLEFEYIDPWPDHLSKSLAFPKLKELCINISSLEDLNLFKNVKLLKKATIQTKDKCAAEKSITFLLETQTLMEKMQLCTNPNNFKFIVEKVHSVLFDIRNQEKKELFIGFILYGSNSVDHDILKSIPCQMMKILNMLEKTKIVDYIVCVRLQHSEPNMNNHKNTLKNVLCELNEMKKDYLVNWDVNKKEKLEFTASNKECKINGYGIDFMWGLIPADD